MCLVVVFFLKTLMTLSLSWNSILIFLQSFLNIMYAGLFYEYHFYEFTQNNNFFLSVICFFGLVFQFFFVLSLPY